jgi:uncharacterized protein YehS (DUF1456 family)
MEQPEVVIEGLDVIDVVRYISRKKDKFIAIVLADLEEVMEKDSNEYKFIRKLFLDGFNDYTRSVMRTLFGNVEGLIMK